ncbi:hypothetical protein TNCV_3588471 [Trichonephila clavipes]|nr:hypothetical protein TNCV_3588471 [Trichonephila clavipes]
MDATEIYYYTLESKTSSAEWTAAVESYPKRPKTSTGKVMASVFWHKHGINLIDYLEKDDTISREYYIEQCSVPQVQEKNGQIERIALRITFPPTVQSRSGPQLPLAVCRPQKKATRKEVWLK